MRRLLAFAALASLLVFAACGGDDGVDIVGATPEEAADELANAGCDRDVECGVWQIDIELDEQGNVTSCTAVPMDVVHAECVADEREQLREILECSMPTDAEAEMINQCFNDAIAQDCLAEAEVTAYCEALENGEEVDQPGQAPASCEALQAIFEGCIPEL